MLKKNKVILTLNSATNLFSIGLAYDTVFFEKTYDSPNPDHSSMIIPFLKKILSVSKLNINDVSLLGVNIGPGSFTGLRVGLSFIKTVALELNIKIFITNSFYIAIKDFFDNFYEINNFKKMIVMLNSVKGEVFYCEYEIVNEFLVKENCITRCEKIDKILSLKDVKKFDPVKNVYIVNSEEVFEKLKNVFNNVKIVKPTANTISRIFMEDNIKILKYNNKSYSKMWSLLPINKLKPLYIRQTYY